MNKDWARTPGADESYFWGHRSCSECWWAYAMSADIKGTARPMFARTVFNPFVMTDLATSNAFYAWSHAETRRQYIVRQWRRVPSLPTTHWLTLPLQRRRPAPLYTSLFTIVVDKKTRIRHKYKNRRKKTKRNNLTKRVSWICRTGIWRTGNWRTWFWRT